ncbi:MAG: hypothetical protein A2849_01935 [Candidatus Taylorbacteria bacterium RIFCSPHIGHO2_01_FULL_51_15]|uniref:Thioredoxin domain-containing protein n=1 Tax=Candidatus Taylorbacteria bacterium RIFCSPHIGHO2_01_FULL_51_15 TaxID=1802304 RepID=A0A1G2MAG9_9BACT|nr:MAG: hypothetical protein A2849_01935 [Candidatus Taylorbacteria bacterium RIFCSPHIGHO2_01_FULL_51_15]
MQKQYLITGGIVLILLVGLLIYAATHSNLGPGKLDSFAQCLKDKQVQFFGAFWCPHCAAQKALFGKSQKLLPYIECSLPSGSGQTQVCIDNKIQGYPTWVFPDGTRKQGEMTLAQLSEKSSCPLPTGESATAPTENASSTENSSPAR